jgi:hypothetical protein
MSGLNSVQIQALVRQMDESKRRHKGLLRSNKNEYRKKLVDENETLYNIFPTIFEMHFEGKLDETFFNMLKLRRKIENGEITEDDASKIVGQQLFDRFVGPKINNTPPPPTPMSYEQYYRQFQTEQSAQPGAPQESQAEQ